MFTLHEDSWYSVKDNFCFNDLFEYKKIKTNKRITYYNDILAFDIETSSFDEEIEEDYKDVEVYDYLLGTTLKITQKFYDDIPDLNSIRVSLFGRLYFSKNRGIRVDSLYETLVDKFPWCFPDDIINPADQLERIIAVFYENSPEKQKDDTKRAVMYVWQLAINGQTIIGRTWDEFIDVINQISDHFKLQSDKRMIIWVHNLSFEFEWMKDLFEWEKVFAISPRKPIYALTTNGIEFRCSYMLSNLSLANVGKSLRKYTVSKLVGDLDYEKVRHNKTPLTDKEIHYCINDVLVISAWIKERVDEAGDITRLPLTATGYCRNYVRNNCLVGKDKESQFKKYHDMISHLTISGVDEYNQMVRAFAGGFTHCSTRFSCLTLKSVDSFDFTSSYPYVLCSEKFPMSKGRKVEVKTYKELYHYCKIYCCIFDIKFINIKPKYINENYISISKCYQVKNAVTNNGRLVGADQIAITITNVDFEIISRIYSWDSIEIGTFRIYKRDYLPKEIIMSICKLYKDKTELKNVAGKEDFYTKGKQLLNSIYGMMVTSIIMPVNTYGPYGWEVEEKEAEKEIKHYNKSKKRFLFYPWGIFCTAYARKNLWSGILSFGDDYIYSDTDSIKAINADKHMGYINSYNRMVERKLRIVAAKYDIPFDYFKPKTIKGVEKLLGVWDKETDNPWKLFKSLGAKRYMILDSDHNLTITVSGVNKKAAVPYLKEKYGKARAFYYFNEQLEIPAENTGKLTHYYLDYPMEGEVTDYLGNTIHYQSMSGIYLEKASYCFSMESAYLNYLKEVRGEIF